MQPAELMHHFQQLRRHYQAVEQIGSVLDKIASFDLALTEAQGRAEAAERKDNELQRRLQATISEISEAEAKAKSIVADAQQRANEIVTTAETQIQKEKKKADAANESVHARVVQLDNQMIQRHSELSAATRKLADINGQIKTAEEQLASFKERIVRA